MPHLLPAGGEEGPAEEQTAVVEPEHVVLVLNVVLVEQRVDLLQLGGGGGGGLVGHFICDSQNF